MWHGEVEAEAVLKIPRLTSELESQGNSNDPFSGLSDDKEVDMDSINYVCLCSSCGLTLLMA